MTVTTRITAGFDPADLAYDDRGLVPVVVQEIASGAVLMLAWADREAVERTLTTGRAHFWSRSRQALWMKGETSGNVLHVADVRRDCDGDALLYRADAAGPTCHTGVRSCFENEGGSTGVASSGPAWELGWLDEIVNARRDAPADESYTARLLAAGVDRCARKLGEEATETVIAALRAEAAGEGEAGAEARAALAGEAADLAYHLLVLLAAVGGDAAAVAAELRRRHVAPRPPEPKPEAAATSQTPAADTP
ncbi:MAG TPA: bifunctional phosphoribosyl-AMP cyclohydrolase/phosphoribosyl-ATP diphosphatase HisIE [Thermoanaerobaculia bacterium]|nr:bifunctional phosphoribosyl-AMP cyclohydrolase/phosphoribosyl-ATP diphosphatase HisIE [Thermoanaerobaculia bacterium]